MIKERKMLTLFILLVLLLISGWFYWFEYRPAEVRKSCTKEATRGLYVTTKNNRYRECLANHGFKPESLFVK